MKQETLEEVAEKYANEWEEIYPELDPENMTPIEISKIDFIAGALWKQERSYSEEDLKLLLKKFKKDIINSTELDDDFETLVCDIETNKWFNKFKKK